eukprot:TRINITY_DN33575_c0_g1_i1.p2 TRINITY_DN33575_c0_g1~~TRINITY_DN33575_c0_g1_i1.p2  ORF type:complete len:136 (+),score=50.97 TRINITY_DN33575_c0_g1_i1:47-454(+)
MARRLAGTAAAAGIGVALAAMTPSGDGKMYRGRVDTARLGHNGAVAACGYLPLATLDEVHYANEIPFEPTPCASGVYVKAEVLAAADGSPGRLAAGAAAGREVHAVFEARTSLLGNYLPLDDMSNLELRVFAARA